MRPHLKFGNRLLSAENSTETLATQARITWEPEFKHDSCLSFFFVISIGWDWYDWASETFPSPLFEPLRIARLQGYQLFDSTAHGHQRSSLFHVCSN